MNLIKKHKGLASEIIISAETKLINILYYQLGPVGLYALPTNKKTTGNDE